MLKPILLGGAMIFAAPAIAQSAATMAPHNNEPVTMGVDVAEDSGRNDGWNWEANRERRGLSYWVNTGDMGVLGSRQFGLASTWGSHSHATMNMDAAASDRSEAYNGMGGPLDIDSQWSSISANGSGLDRIAFGTWLLEQNGEDVDRQVRATMRSRAVNLPAVQVLNVTGEAFSDADMNGDMRISRDELRAFAEG